MSLIIEESELLPILEIAANPGPISVHAKRNFAAVFGPIQSDSRIHAAIAAAKRADVPLFLAGEVIEAPPHGSYWRQNVLPQLDQRHRWIGAADPRRIRALISAARCILIPGPDAKANSLLALDALAEGTPVVAFTGSGLSKIVQHGRTGFLVNDETEMAEAIRAAAFISPEACRNTERGWGSGGWLTGRNTDRAEPAAER